MKNARMAALYFLLLTSIGCTSAERADLFSYGNKHHIELWSGGQKVHTWVSTGKVLNEKDSDGYFFMDNETGKLVRVTGDLVITVAD
jgi:outer membrane lipoprotein-sorting protein